ncbi:hypothetical protein CN692_10085 [Bacillus sp. AFS002410]|uniref:hypothetical protein n=1 Tax=Bacillus sp. AFS002410 TaxID=2033481 RepID=UPI000BF1C451|nr:hypothetical protein [Bacillus sp. AFS002410]PEJ58608.1 hypothetical protein CN692_10085 [Bacillus sp. AFS002410]
MNEKELMRGQPITFRIPSDTPDQIVKQLRHLKETERRNFSSKIAEFVMDGVNNSLSKQKQTITIPLPKSLSKAQKDWLKHEHSEALLGNIVYQLLMDPIRTASLLTSINSNSLEIDEALYLNEEVAAVNEIMGETNYKEQTREAKLNDIEEAETNVNHDDLDLENFDWTTASKNEITTNDEDEVEEDMDDLLGEFLAQMNK